MFRLTRLASIVRLEIVSLCRLRFWISTETKLVEIDLVAVRVTTLGAMTRVMARS